MTTPEALKALYVALGGDADDVATANTSVEVLNAIAVKFEGDGDATLNPEAIMNVVAVVDNMMPEPTLIDKNITANGTYNASSDEADGYKKVVVNVAEQNNARFAAGTGYFNYLTQIEFLSVPEGYGGINQITGSTNTGFLKEVVLPSTLTSIATDAFSRTQAIEKITINKPEDSISGAPWGAPASCQIIWAG